MINLHFVTSLLRMFYRGPSYMQVSRENSSNRSNILIEIQFFALQIILFTTSYSVLQLKRYLGDLSEKICNKMPNKKERKIELSNEISVYGGNCENSPSQSHVLSSNNRSKLLYIFAKLFCSLVFLKLTVYLRF